MTVTLMVCPATQRRAVGHRDNTCIRINVEPVVIDLVGYRVARIRVLCKGRQAYHHAGCRGRRDQILRGVGIAHRTNRRIVVDRPLGLDVDDVNHDGFPYRTDRHYPLP